MDFDRYKIKVNTFTAELEQPIDREKRTIITTEVDCYDVSTPSNEDGTFNEVFKCKVVGSTLVKQGEAKPLICKSKRSLSQRMRMAIWQLNSDELFYESTMNKIMNNLEEIIEYLKEK